MNNQFTQPDKIVNVQMNKQAIARVFNLKGNEVAYLSTGLPLSGYKVLYDKLTQTSWNISNATGSVINWAISDNTLTLTTSAGIFILPRALSYNSLEGISAEMLPYTPNVAGGVKRTQADKNSETISVKDFGAIGDGVTDDSDAFQLAANTGSIIMPPGNYLITKTITLNGSKDCLIRGTSRAEVSITYTGSDLLFTGTFTDSIRFIECSGFQALTNKKVAKGLYVAWPEDFEHSLVQRGNIFNTAWRGVDEYTQGWSVPIHSHQGDNILINFNEFKGIGYSTTLLSQAANTVSAFAIQITGRFSPVEYKIMNNFFGSYDTGIKVEDTAEGIYVNNNTFVGVKNGVFWQTGNWSNNWPGAGGQSASGRPLLIFAGNHCNFYGSAVITDGVVSIHEYDNLVYHNDNATQNGYAFLHSNATDIFNRNNEVWGFNTQYYVDAVVLVANVSFSEVDNLRLVTGATNACRYAVEARDATTRNNMFKNITRRSTGGTFIGNVLINDLSGGLNDIGIRGAFLYSTANQSVPSGSSVPTVVNFGARDYDPLTIWPGSGGAITIPPGVSRIRLTGGVLLDAAATNSYRELGFTLNGTASSPRGFAHQSASAVTGKGTYLNVTTGIVLTTPGDVIRMVVGQDDGVARSLIANYCWLQVEFLG